MCHVSHLVLAASLFFGFSLGVWVTSLWLVVGLVLWVWEIVVTRHIRSSFVTSFTHIVGFFLAYYSMKEVGHYPHAVWPWAGLFFIIMQVVSRLTTPKELNVNVAHDIHRAMASLFRNYYSYWLFNFILQLIALIVFEFIAKTLLITLERL